MFPASYECCRSWHYALTCCKWALWHVINIMCTGSLRLTKAPIITLYVFPLKIWNVIRVAEVLTTNSNTSVELQQGQKKQKNKSITAGVIYILHSVCAQTCCGIGLSQEVCTWKICVHKALIREDIIYFISAKPGCGKIILPVIDINTHFGFHKKNRLVRSVDDVCNSSHMPSTSFFHVMSVCNSDYREGWWIIRHTNEATSTKFMFLMWLNISSCKYVYAHYLRQTGARSVLQAPQI